MPCARHERAGVLVASPGLERSSVGLRTSPVDESAKAPTRCDVWGLRACADSEDRSGVATRIGSRHGTLLRIAAPTQLGHLQLPPKCSAAPGPSKGRHGADPAGVDLEPRPQHTWSSQQKEPFTSFANWPGKRARASPPRKGLPRRKARVRGPSQRLPPRACRHPVADCLWDTRVVRPPTHTHRVRRLISRSLA